MAKIIKKNHKKNQNLILLSLIVSLGIFLRLYRLDRVPISLSGDEVDIGYNSFSLLKTSRDVTGHRLPVSLQTLIDTKPSLLASGLISFVNVKLFGLSEWSIRLPNAILGTLGILVMYLLVKELFANHSTSQESRSLPRHLRGVSLLSSFLLAISPWHLHFSRGAFEVQVASFLVLLGVYWFLVGLRRPLFLFLASLSFALSLYTYHSTKIIVPYCCQKTIGQDWFCQRPVFS